MEDHLVTISPPKSNEKRRRKRVQNACVNCRSARASCCEYRPCYRCVQFDLSETCSSSPSPICYFNSSHFQNNIQKKTKINANVNLSPDEREKEKQLKLVNLLENLKKYNLDIT